MRDKGLVALVLLWMLLIGLRANAGSDPIVAAEPIGQFRAAVSESARGPFLEAVRAFADGKKFSYKARLIRPDGKHLDIQLQRGDISVTVVNPFDSPEDFRIIFYNEGASDLGHSEVAELIDDMKTRIGKPDGVSLAEDAK